MLIKGFYFNNENHTKDLHKLKSLTKEKTIKKNCRYTVTKEKMKLSLIKDKKYPRILAF
jgi:hypothetical protein